MEVIIDKNISTYKQIKGFGEVISTFNLIINVTDMLDIKDNRRFILSIQINANGNVYHYNNIYMVEEIQPDGDIVVGEITIIGEADLSTIDLTARVIYLE